MLKQSLWEAALLWLLSASCENVFCCKMLWVGTIFKVIHGSTLVLSGEFDCGVQGVALAGAAEADWDAKRRG